MKRTYLLACALLLTLVAPPVFTAESAGQIRVPGDFATIQEAVNAAAPGDTISVSPGIYCEHVVISTPDLRLRAAPAIGGDRAILSGACAAGAYGFHVLGAAAATPVSGVEISGFVVEGFDTGIVLQNATRALVHLNDVNNSVYRGSVTVPGYLRSQGIVLIASSLNEISQNWSHDNGHLGIGLFNGSDSNLVRGNRLTDNRGACALMLWGTTNRGNQLLENEIASAIGVGIMIGPGAQTGNLVAQNRVHGHSDEGIIVGQAAWGNVIENNNALGNGLAGWTDLWDGNGNNQWLHNLGTCEPGNAGCQ